MTGRSNLLTHALKQTAVYWANPRSDGTGGRTFDEAAEINVRWEEKQELFIDRSGQEVRSQAVVFVGQDVDMGGYLYLGRLADLSSAEEDDPLSIATAYEIRGTQKIPSIKAMCFMRKIWL